MWHARAATTIHPMSMDLSDRRVEYANRGLDPADVDPDPLAQFAAWFAEADQAGVADLGDCVGPARDDADGERVPVRRLVDRFAAEVRIGEERVDRGGEGRHVRRAERSTCGRVQIGSGLLSISSRTHSSRSRSGIARA